MADDPEITDPRDPYKRPDIVTELDRWLTSRASLREATVSHALLQGARDEIVALREMRKAVLSTKRAEALEEAAQKAEHYEAPIWSAMIAAAIRTLKEKGT